MVFSSSVFLFVFLPLVLLCLMVVPGVRGKNVVLVIASLIFYAYGEGIFVLLMLVVMAVNWIAGHRIEQAGTEQSKRAFLVAAIVFNLLILGFFKYFGFFGDTVNTLLEACGENRVQFWHIHLPLGISFYMFHMMSYVADIYWKRIKPERSALNFTLYTVLFPQLVAGPIVRYRQVAHRLSFRVVTTKGFAEGVERFVIGLAKKVLIANQVAVPADKIFALTPDQLSSPVAWFGIFCYTLQIYFDFSGYSDMAIGIGRMFGFRFPENFRYPYISQSIREFWRRWHITLSSWFRDYVYIPLGGSYGSPLRTQLNLIIVFLLCGLWHGASWTFVIWGAYHGIFLSLERTRFATLIDALPRVFRHAYALLAVAIGWVFFRADSLAAGLNYLGTMFGLGSAGAAARPLSAFASNDVIAFGLIGVLASTPIPSRVHDYLRKRIDIATTRPTGNVTDAGFKTAALAIAHSYSLLLTGVLALATSYLIVGSYNPFIYFRF